MIEHTHDWKRIVDPEVGFIVGTCGCGHRQLQALSMNLKEKAHHEAAHLTSAFVLKLAITGPATIEGGEDFSAAVFVANPLDELDAGAPTRIERMEDYIVTLYAGSAAFSLLSDYPFEGCLTVTGRSDASKAKDILIAEGYEDQSYARALQVKAFELVQTHWNKIHALAEVLVREKTLQPDSILEILRKTA